MNELLYIASLVQGVSWQKMAANFPGLFLLPIGQSRGRTLGLFEKSSEQKISPFYLETTTVVKYFFFLLIANNNTVRLRGIFLSEILCQCAILFSNKNVETNFFRQSFRLQPKRSGPKSRNFRSRDPPTRGRKVRPEDEDRGGRHSAVGLVQQRALPSAGQGDWD